MSKQNRKNDTAGITDSVPVDMPVGAETAAATEDTQAEQVAESPAPVQDGPPANAVVARIMQARRADDPVGSLVLVVSPENAGVLSEFIANSQSASTSAHSTVASPQRTQGRARRTSREVRRHSSRRPAHAAADRTGKTRGRVAGRYVMGSKEPTYLTDSIGGVYKFIGKHKRGATAKEVAEALKMPMGTVGWALQVLKKTGAIDTQAA